MSSLQSDSPSNSNKSKQWRWSENDFAGREPEYEIKVHKEEAIQLIETWYLHLYRLTSHFPFHSPRVTSNPPAIHMLKENYERRSGVCTAKRGLYADYRSFCRENGVEACNNSAFGKVFKKIFPGVETRRLGKRSSNMTFYHDFAKKGTSGAKLAGGPTIEVSEAVTPLRRPKRSLKDSPKNKPASADNSKRPRREPTVSLREDADMEASKREAERVGLDLAPAQGDKLAVLMNYSETYWREVWALAALNPACLESKTVASLFFSPRGMEPDIDPILALNTYHALSVGAFLLGDLEAAEDLFQRTRCQLGGVFDTTSYDVANALCGIAFWHRFATTSRRQLEERTAYYLNQCLQICRILRDTSNDIYLTAMREWGNFVGFSEDWLQAVGEVERGMVIDYQPPTYARFWSVDSKYILIHTHQKGLFNNVCREGENFYRHLINYEKAVGSQGGVPGNDNSEATLRSNLHNQKCVVDNFTIGILHGEVRFLPLATSIIIHMNLILHVRYYAAIGHMERARQAATMLVKLLVSLPKAFKAVLISRMEGTIKEFVAVLEEGCLISFTRLLSEFEGRYVQLVCFKEICEACQERRQKEGLSRKVLEEAIEPTGREKDELLEYFLAAQSVV
jgi:hypothetical protein